MFKRKKKLLDTNQEKKLIESIFQAEQYTTGEVIVHIAPKISKTIMLDAQKVFFRLKINKTQDHNGVLIFIAQNDAKFAILGDVGINQKVDEEFWNQQVNILEIFYNENKGIEGIRQVVFNIGEQLKKYFPSQIINTENQLPNEISY